MKEIYRLFLASKNYSSKYKKYFEIYEDLFKRFKDKDITFVEIGIQNGGSLEIWKKYRCLKCESTFFINVRGNHSGGPKSADGQEWRVAVDKEILEARRQLTDSTNSLELTLEMFNPFKGRIAMVVAHPDDETLWGGGLLSRLFPIDIIFQTPLIF